MSTHEFFILFYFILFYFFIHFVVLVVVGQFGLLLYKIANSDYYNLVSWGSFFFLPLGVSDREEGGAWERRVTSHRHHFSKFPETFPFIGDKFIQNARYSTQWDSPVSPYSHLFHAHINFQLISFQQFSPSSLRKKQMLPQQVTHNVGLPVFSGIKSVEL